MFFSTSLYGRKGLPIMAISGIDLALWDIIGKNAGLPVWKLLGGAAKSKAEAYFTGSDLEKAKRLGFGNFKIGLYEGVGGTDLESTKKLIAALQKARGIIGPDARLMIDCLCRWNVEYTLDFAKRAADAGVNLYWIEEPLWPDDYAGYQRLCAEVKGVKITSGEHEYTRFGFQELLRHKAAHILQPDQTWCGGLTDARKVATIAAAHGVPVMPHRGGSIFSIHLVIAHSNCLMAESFGTAESGNEMMERLTPQFEKGAYLPPDKPGLGVDLPRAVLKKYVPSLAD